MRLRPRYVRDRLTFWYVVVFGLVLVAYIGGATFLLFWQLTSQMYHAEIQDVETAEGLLYFLPNGNVGMHEEYHNHPQSRLLIDRLMEVLSPEGQVLFRNDQLKGRELGGPIFNGEGHSGYYERSVRLADGTRVLMISHIHSINGRPLLIRLGYSTEVLSRRIGEFVLMLLAALPIALVISAFAGYRMAGKILRPLQQMARKTEQISTSHPHDRIPVENPDDELGYMATVVNGLLQRFEVALDQSKRFSSDVSHELRTPLASIRSVGEVGLQQEQTPDGYRDIIGSMLEEVAKLTHMTETLLTMSRADAGQIMLRQTTFPLMSLLHELTGLVEVLADENGQHLSLAGDEEIQIHADRTFLGQAIFNLLHNAVKYGQ
jgi:signal transduction histidine kinase